MKYIIEPIDRFLDKITMYRLVLYSLMIMLLGAVVLSFFDLLPHNPSLLLLGALFILIVCHFSNTIFARVFQATANVESVYITALILVLIVSPIKDIGNLPYWGFLFWVSVWAMASKYIFAIGKKHLFNPAAFAVMITAFTMNQSASWWAGTLYMLPFVLVAGLLITRKLRRFDLVLTFLGIALVSIVGARFSPISGAINTGTQALFYSPLFFFAFIMLTEPMTTPPKKSLRLVYGALVGFLFSPFMHIGSIYSTPELALLVGNIFSYIVSPKHRLVLKLKEKVKIADETYDFVFAQEKTEKKFNFTPGQYLEWTGKPENSDTRGNRRYFTIASSPTEEEVRMGVKFYPNGSTFKKKLLAMIEGDVMAAGSLAGEFVIPKDKNKKLAFLAGGIGITPFRSILKYLLDSGEKRDMVMLYSNKTDKDVAYQNIISEAEMRAGLRNMYVITDKVGMVNRDMIKKEIPDYKDRYFYLSGTHGMVVAFDKMLRELGVPKSQIKKDFFPGYA